MGFEKKTFAFKLAEKTANQDGAKWKARPEVSATGCTGPDTRSDYDAWGQYRGYDNGMWC
jgi:hypothetical protein